MLSLKYSSHIFFLMKQIFTDSSQKNFSGTKWGWLVKLREEGGEQITEETRNVEEGNV